MFLSLIFLKIKQELYSIKIQLKTKGSFSLLHAI